VHALTLIQDMTLIRVLTPTPIQVLTLFFVGSWRPGQGWRAYCQHWAGWRWNCVEHEPSRVTESGVMGMAGMLSSGIGGMLPSGTEGLIMKRVVQNAAC